MTRVFKGANVEPLTVPGTLDSLAAIGQYVVAAATTAGLDKKAAYRLRLAVDEIATNVITHGYEEANRAGYLELQAVIDAAALTIILDDTGAAYAPDQALQQTELNAPLGDRPIGGLGVYLAMQGVDQFGYERLGGQNRHTFTMRRHAPAAPE
jgi:anti-sigma regulatory factor (Ser/Thr protein kinase)